MAPALYGLVLAELLYVAWVDLRTHQIPNAWALVHVGVAPVLYLSTGPFYPLSWEALIFPIGFIVFGFLLYLVNIMGAGDSKYLASLFLLVPPEYHLPLFEKLVVTTAITGALLLAYRSAANRRSLRAYVLAGHWAGVRQLLRSRFSYAPVITLAWIIWGVNLWN
jgi:prepilin peptidase CpaA